MLHRMQRSEQRLDRSEPFGGVQKKLAEELEKVGDDRLVRETERLFE